MAEIKNLTLQIDPAEGLPNFHVTSVSFRLAFVESEWGKDYRYSISLLPGDISFAGTPNQEDPSPAVLYKFKFGGSTTTLVKANGPFVDMTLISHAREVPNHILNEDYREEPVDPDSQAPREHRDEIRALVTLITSNVPIVVAQKQSAIKKLLL
jgi:hypothetical protein